MPNPRSRIFSRAISSVRSTPCCVAGMGTLAYGDAWNLFDNIVVSENLVNAKPGELRLVRAPGSKYYGNVFKRNYMIQREGQFKGYPLRTYVGNNFQGGYSDHFPVYIYIGK